MKNTNNKRKVIIGVTLGLLVLAAIVFFVVIKKPNKSVTVSDAHTEDQLKIERI